MIACSNRAEINCTVDLRAVQISHLCVCLLFWEAFFIMVKLPVKKFVAFEQPVNSLVIGTLAALPHPVLCL